MAITPTRQEVGSDAILVTWALTTADATGVAIGPEITSQYRDITIHARGTWGGATAAMQGANENTDGYFGAVTSASGGAAITYTADAGSPKACVEVSAYLRPKLTTAGAGATVYVTAYCSRAPFARGRSR